MNTFGTGPIESLGYNFISKEFLPEGEHEYYLRFQQSASKAYRALTTEEIDTLERNRNTCTDWSKVLVTDGFLPELVKNVRFFGLVRIGKLEPIYREFHNLKLPVGIYNSTIISSDIGDNVCIHHVGYMSHYIIEDEVMIFHVDEMQTTEVAKFGTGILKHGEEGRKRVQLELCNENAGRAVIPFEGMLPGDAYIWSRHRHDHQLQQQLLTITEAQFDKRRGFYGVIGQRTVIKSTNIIINVHVGTDAYIKGANKLKNLTIRSDAERKSQIGEGCELVNGIIGYGCRIFYGVKAVRFITAAHSQLKYGARLINSYLGNNATISCCEVLNSLIFPAHEQHHNNSFLCASLIMGQSNIAAGATLGSNHNSRAADGEIIAGRGFWPGLCVSLKHNSKFASFTILAKGDYPAELNVHLPFCLISNDVANDRLLIQPGYWFRYNMYALERNAWKYTERDQRTDKIQRIDYDYLAPDTIQEMITAIEYLSQLEVDEKDTAQVSGIENSKRAVIILKVKQSIALFRDLIKLHAGLQLIALFNETNPKDFATFKAALNHIPSQPEEWENVGGQLIQKRKLHQFLEDIKKGNVKDWNEIHDFYLNNGATYTKDKFENAVASWLYINNISIADFNESMWSELLDFVVKTRTEMTQQIYTSRAKDYKNAFRKMVYENDEEMDEVIGKLEGNSFVTLQNEKLEELKTQVTQIKSRFAL